MDARLDGQTAFVTGAASGIGYALTVALVGAGAFVYAADVDETGLARLADQLGSEDVLTTVELDVRDEAAVKGSLARAVAERGRLDLLFNNAGIVVGGDFEDMDRATWQRIVDVNLWGVVNGTQHGYALMLAQGGGHIVNTASTAGLVPVARSAAYAATKHAVVGLSTSLREEGARKGVKVSVVVPGVVDTAIFASATNVGGHDYQASMDRVPFAKISPERAAEHILRGVSRNAPYIVFPFYNKAITRLYRAAPRLVGPAINR